MNHREKMNLLPPCIVTDNQTKSNMSEKKAKATPIITNK